MSLVLSRVDYTNVGVTCCGTTKILPSSDPKGTQKFAVGDHDGVLHIFCMKKNELQLIFKSLPGPKIEKLVLGGGAHDLLKDKIFIGYGNSVKGFNKKGKMFLEFDTNLMDSITAMFVLGSDLAACSRDIYHRYKNCKDADSYLVGETLNDVILVPSDSGSVTAILACNDRAIRILSGTKSPTLLRLPSVPTVFSIYRDGGRELYDRVLVGTQEGKIGLLVTQSNKTVRITWIINTSGSEITALDTCELNHSDAVDILVGRLDGTIEIFNFVATEEESMPMLRFKYNAGESISSVGGGIIGAPGYPEVLVTTYSGKIFGLTTKPPGALEAGTAANEETINRLQAEIYRLEAKLNEAREYDYSTTDSLSPLVLAVNHRIILNRETATYSLSIELDGPIDNILIQSDTPVSILDESNNAVLSLSATDPANDGNFVLATYRCQVNTNQLETRIRTNEGQPGTLQVYVTSQIQPKCCRKIKIHIVALSLHTRVHDDENMDNDGSNRGPHNELRLSGSFTVAEMHAWLSMALSDMSERPNLRDNEVTLNYVSTLVGSKLKCNYKKGSAIFSSENISTILVLRDLMTKEATKRKIKLDVSCVINDGSISRMFELILPQLNAAHELIEHYKIINALYAWEMIDNPQENLCTYYKELLKKEDEIRNKYLKCPNILDILNNVIIDLYVDWQRAKGYSRVATRVAEENLADALKSRKLSAFLDAFIEKNDKDDKTDDRSVDSNCQPSPILNDNDKNK